MNNNTKINIHVSKKIKKIKKRHAFTLYQSKNIPVLCDTIGTLADAVGLALVPFVPLLLPPLVAKWKQLCPSGVSPTYNTMLQVCPLLECITSVVQALGSHGVRPHGNDLFRGAVEVMFLQVQCVEEKDRLLRDPGLVCALDLLSALARVNGNDFWNQFMGVKASGGKTVYEMITLCLQKDAYSYEVRQSACSLIGEIAKGCGKQSQSIFDNVMPSLVNNLDVNHSPLFNNASWAIGEWSVVATPAQIMPHVEKVMSSLQVLVRSEDAPLVSVSFLYSFILLFVIIITYM
jgi:hypothetical protein